MKLSDFKSLLQTHPNANFRLILPDETAVPVSFHITEVAHVQKRFIDCGGTLRTTDTCQLQVWEGDDSDHRLVAGRMAKVLDMAKVVLPEGQDLDIEFEYEDTTISQYPVAGFAVTDDAVVLNLENKHTDCLAKELCGPKASKFPMLALTAPGGTYCSPGSGCC